MFTWAKIELEGGHDAGFWIALLIAIVGLAHPTRADDLDRVIEAAISRAADNAPQVREALAKVPDAQRAGMRFLVAYMPERDLKTLTADFLLTNVDLAYRARDKAPWKDQLSDEMFFNDVLPYAIISETRDGWRAAFYKKLLPLVAEAKTPGEAAVILNQKIFDLYGVKFSRKRTKADQSPLETIESGMASCTGLSIMLVNACRAVGVPARLVGTPMWVDRSGNHSWVEVYDNGWHFTGAAEPSGDKLNRGWFSKRATTAKRDNKMHAIYAISYRPTGTKFPVRFTLDAALVDAINVTDRYTQLDKPQAAEPMVKMDIEASLHAVAQLEKYLKSDPAQRPAIGEQLFADVPLTAEHAAQAQQLLWEDHVRQIRKTRAQEMKDRKLTHGDKVMPFFYSFSGKPPASGRSLYISMHGGGGAPAAVNDRQWENQKRLYHVEEGVYVAPRAPTNTWNLWHQKHIDVLFDRLIENMIVFEQVDPNRVYLLGYSAGGDGVYQLAPRMADRFAAASMMAGHPNDASPLGLRNLPFSIHVGANDAAYKRNQVARNWGDKLDNLQKEYPGGYVHWTKIYPAKGHWMDREDAAALPWMAKYTRDPLPKKIVWRQDDVTHTRFYWLAIPEDRARKNAEVRASRDGQHIDIQSADLKQLIVRLNDQMVDLDKSVKITKGSQTLFEGRASRTIGTLAQSLGERGDPASVFSAQVSVKLPETP